MKLRWRYVATLLVTCGVVLTAVPARAAPITIGSPAGFGNVFPLGASTYAGSYQQVYAAFAFPDPLVITEISFFLAGRSQDYSLTTTFALGLSTTSMTPASLSTNYTANRGADFATVFDGTISATSSSTVVPFVVPLDAPFSYDPAAGNLLLDVFVVNNTITPLGPIPPGAIVVPFLWGPDPAIARVFNFGGTGVPLQQPDGLVTRFSDGVPVPEPGALMLLGVGLVGVACRRARLYAARRERQLVPTKRFSSSSQLKTN